LPLKSRIRISAARKLAAPAVSISALTSASVPRFEPIKKETIDMPVMIVAAGLLVAGVVGSLALIIRELRKAPEGYEHGFYTVRNGAVEYGLPDSIIKKARRTRSSVNWPMHRTPAH
jgi:hypothetical protein